MKAVPAEPEVVAFLKDNGGSYKRAARHFGITSDEIRAIAGKPARSRAGARGTTKAEQRSKLTPLEWRLDKLVQLERVIDDAMSAERPNAVGIAALMKSAISLRGEIDLLLDAKPDEFENMTPEEIRDYLGTVMEQWPNQHLELAMLVYAERHGGQVVFVAEGGGKTEYSAEDGWRAIQD